MSKARARQRGSGEGQELDGGAITTWDLDYLLQNTNDMEDIFQEDFFNNCQWVDMMPSASSIYGGPRNIAEYPIGSSTVVAPVEPQSNGNLTGDLPRVTESHAKNSSVPNSDGSSEESHLSFKERRREAVRKSRSKKKEYLKNLEEKAQRLEKETEELEKLLEEKLKRKVPDCKKNSESDKQNSNLSVAVEKLSRASVPSSAREQRMKTMQLFVNALSPEGASTIDDVKLQIWDPNVQLVCPLFSKPVVGVDERVQKWKDLVKAIPDGRFEYFEIAPEDYEAKQVRTKFIFRGVQVNPLNDGDHPDKVMDRVFKMQSKREIIVKGKSYMTFGDSGRIVQEICMWNHSELVMDLMGMSPERNQAE